MGILDIYYKFSEKYFYKNFKVIKNNVQHEGCTWYNTVFFNDLARYNHIEYFKSDNNLVEVFHNVMLPNASLNCGIFGFDMIALNNKITGIFCDITNGSNENLKRIKHHYRSIERDRPEWASFFSKDFLIVKSPENLEDFINDIMLVVDEYLNPDISSVYDAFNEHKNISIQNEYCMNQRKNAKTYNALTKFIGEEEAKKFIEQVLFPVTFQG
jgi:hypothetical protein